MSEAERGEFGTRLGPYDLEHPLMNAAGTCKTLEQVECFARAPVSAVVVGSITWEERPGNSGTVYQNGGHCSLNSLGLPNPGAEFYRLHLPTMADAAAGHRKVLIISVAGFSPEEYAALTEVAVGGLAHCVELNLGCPNVWGRAGQKPIASFYPEMIKAILEEVARVDRKDTVIGVKLSPFSNPGQLDEVVRVISGQTWVEFITCSNTFPNAFAWRERDKPAIDVGYAGMAGPALKPIALGQVKRVHELLPDMAVVGAGGVARGRDVTDYLTVGATAVQAATVYWNSGEDPGVYGDVLADLVEDLAP